MALSEEVLATICKEYMEKKSCFRTDISLSKTQVADIYDNIDAYLDATAPSFNDSTSGPFGAFADSLTTKEKFEMLIVIEQKRLEAVGGWE